MMSAGEGLRKQTGSLAAAFGATEGVKSPSGKASPLLSPLRKAKSEKAPTTDNFLSVSPLKRSFSTGSDGSSRSSPGSFSPNKRSRCDGLISSAVSSLAAAFGAASPSSVKSPYGSPKVAPRSRSAMEQREMSPARHNLQQPLSANSSAGDGKSGSVGSKSLPGSPKSPRGNSSGPTSLSSAFGGAHSSRRGSLSASSTGRKSVTVTRPRGASYGKASNKGDLVTAKAAEPKSDLWSRRTVAKEGFSADRPRLSPLKKVLSAHETKESGLSQDVLDEVSYMLDGMSQTQSLTTRLHSMLSLADRCGDREFRMHLRAHARIPDVVNALISNIDNDQNGVRTLCAVNVIHALTRDRLTAELGATCLPLLVSALAADDVTEWMATQDKRSNSLGESTSESLLLKKTANQVRKMLLSTGHEDCLDPSGSAPSVHIMAVQSIVELIKYSSDVRDRIVPDGVLEAVSAIAIRAVQTYMTPAAKEDDTLASLRMLVACLSVIESMTFMTAAAPMHGDLVSSLLDFLDAINRLGDVRLESLAGHELGRLVAGSVLGAMRVLVNMTNDASVRDAISSREEHLQLVVDCAVVLPSRMACLLARTPQTPGTPGTQPITEPPDAAIEPICEYDMYVHSLGLLVNLLEMCPGNRGRLASLAVPPSPSAGYPAARPLIDALADLFNRANAIGDQVSQRLAEGDTGSGLQQQQTETVVLSAYVAMVIAWLACDNSRNQQYIIHNVAAGRPHASLEQLVARMTQFAHLHEVTGVASMDSEQNHVRSALVILKALLHMAE